MGEIDDETTVYYKASLRLEDLCTELQDADYEDLVIAITELINLRNKTLASFYHAITVSGREEFDDEDAKRFIENLKKAEY